MTERRFGRHTVTLSHEDKVLFPEQGLTKGDLIRYYEGIADTLLPHLRGRPLTLQRFPDGIAEEGFFQQARGDYFPDWLKGLEVDHGGDTGKVTHVLCEHPAALAWLANQGVITLHAWLSRQDHLRRPDRIIFDLDPPGDDFAPVRRAAWRVREALEDAGLVPFVQTTGSRGLHLVAPIQPQADFDRVRQLARLLADRLAMENPDTLTTEQRRDKRRGRLYLDIMRISFGQTAVAPYSVRARAGAPVATPLEWHELDDTSLGPQSYHIGNIFRRLGQRQDPWHDMQRHAVSVTTLAKAVES